MSGQNGLQEKLSMSEIEALMSEAYDPGNWFQFPLNFLDIMTLQEAMMLSYLANHARRVRKHDEWFFCLMRHITRDLRISHGTQSQTIRRLKAHRFLDTETRGLPAKRWMRIRWGEVAKQLKATRADRNFASDDDSEDDDATAY